MRTLACLLAAAVAAGCQGAPRLQADWPPEVHDHASRILFAKDASGLMALAQPDLEAPLILSLDGVADEAWLLLYDQSPRALGLEPGPLSAADARPPCELAAPQRVFRLDAAGAFVDDTIDAVPRALVATYLSPAGAQCVPVDCRLDARWLGTTAHGRITRFFPLPNGDALLVDRSLGLARVELSRGTSEPAAAQPELPLLDARSVDGELFILSASGQLQRGVGPFERAGEPLPLPPAEVRAAGLAVGGDGPEIYAGLLSGTDGALELELLRYDDAGAATSLLRAAVRSRATINDKLSLEWLGPGHVIGVYGGEHILELRDGVATLDGPRPKQETVGGVPLDLLTLVRRSDGTLGLTSHDGSLWAAPGPRAPWTRLHGPPASGVGIGAVALIELGDGWLVPDTNSGATFVHDVAGRCFDGVMPRVYVTAAGRVGDRVIAGGFGQLGLVERTW